MVPGAARFNDDRNQNVRRTATVIGRSAVAVTFSRKFQTTPAPQ
jgi:hypothetical protein